MNRKLSAPQNRSGRFGPTGFRVLQATRYTDCTTTPHLPTTLYTKLMTASVVKITHQTVRPIVAASSSSLTAAAGGFVTVYVDKCNNTPLQQ